MKFSYSKRNDIVLTLRSTQYDVLVIGGGITGAGIALDAVSRGLKVALIEKQDFASGTSSRSTKLIHGGLRYLKQGDIGLVREVGSERAIVHRLAPHLVLPEKMLLPLIEHGNYGYMATSVGLWVYDLLAKVKMNEWRTMLSKSQTLDKEPLLRSDILKGGGFYAEYRTDDARLTIEVIKTAVSKKVDALNYIGFEEFVYENNQIVAALCKNELNNEKIKIKAKYVVNATGPWVDGLRKTDQSLEKKHLHITKGVHLVVDHAKFPVKQSVYFDVPDGRMIFAIPRGKTTYIGTTDTNYTGSLEEPDVTMEDTNYILDAIKYLFPEVQLTIEDVISSWSGLRPLIHEEGKSPSELSRKDEIFVSNSNLISIAGGKLTGYRKMAERVVNLITKKMGEVEKRKFPKSTTNSISLKGGTFENKEAVQHYILKTGQRLAQTNLDYLYVSKYLVHNYGKQSEEIIFKFFDLKQEYTLKNDDAYMILAELWFACEHEMVCKATDFFIRRTGRLYFDPQSVEDFSGIVLNEMKNKMRWSNEQFQAEKEDLKNKLDTAALKNMKQILI